MDERCGASEWPSTLRDDSTHRALLPPTWSGGWDAADGQKIDGGRSLVALFSHKIPPTQSPHNSHTYLALRPGRSRRSSDRRWWMSGCLVLLLNPPHKTHTYLAWRPGRSGRPGGRRWSMSGCLVLPLNPSHTKPTQFPHLPGLAAGTQRTAKWSTVVEV